MQELNVEYIKVLTVEEQIAILWGTIVRIPKKLYVMDF